MWFRWKVAQGKVYEKGTFAVQLDLNLGCW